MQKVAIIGAGNFGQALAHILAGQHEVEVKLWDVEATKVPEMLSLEDTVHDADIIFLCVSSWSLRAAADSIRPLVSDQALIISPTKGIEQETLKTSDEVLSDVFGGNAHTGLLHGPMLAAEIAQDLPAFAVLAMTDRDSYEVVQSIFSDTTLQLEYSGDIHGVALAGVLKNIYSIGLGMADAMALGSNFRGWFVRVAVREMAQIISAFGGGSETAYTGAGLADLIATGFSPYSRNCQVGHEIVQSGECITVSEGAESLPQMMQLLGRVGISTPLCSGISDIVAGKADGKSIDKVIQACLL